MQFISNINELSKKLEIRDKAKEIVKEEFKPLHELISNRLTYNKTELALYLREYSTEFNANNILCEGLIKSYPRDGLIARLKTHLHMRVYPDSPEFGDKDIIIQFYPAESEKFPKFIQMIHQHGWFISHIETNTNDFKGDDEKTINAFLKSSYAEARIIVEAKYGVDTELPRILYHSTLLSVWNLKIKERGLSPKTKSLLSFHPSRVYFTRDPTIAIKLAKNLAYNKINAAKEQSNDKFNPEQYYKTWTILKIDTNKIPHENKLSYFKVYTDSTAEEYNGVYSVNYIPPTAIKLFRTFNAY
jgi:hypothetical protein